MLVETDPEKKRGTMTLVANFGVVATKGSGITKEQAQAAADKLKAQIEAKWKGTYTQDGYTFTVSSKVTVQVMDDSKATSEGQAERVDNVVMLTAGDRGRILETGQEFGGWTYRLPNEKFDRVMVPIAGNLDDVYAHEFTHLLGNPDLRGHILSNTRPAMRAGLSTATTEDFSATFSQLVRAHLNAGSRMSTIVGSDVVYHGRSGGRNYSATTVRSKSIQGDPF